MRRVRSNGGMLAFCLGLLLMLGACTDQAEDVDPAEDGDGEVTTSTAATTTEPITEVTEAPTTTAASTGEPLPPLSLYVPTEDREPENFRAAQMMAEDWSELGLEVEVEAVELFALFEQAFQNHDFQVTAFQWTPRVDRLDPFAYLSFLLPDSPFQGSGWMNDEYIDLFEQQQQEFDPERRRELVFRLQEIPTEDLPIIVTFYSDDVLAYNSETFDGFVSMPGEGLYNEWTPLEVQPLGEDQVLTIGDSGEPESINPYTATSATSWAFLRLYYDKLVRLSPEIEPVPWVADEISFTDETTVDVTIREGLTFHDGEPLTAEDVAFSYQSMIDHEVSYFNTFLAPISEIEVTDDTNVRFLLNEPFSPFANVTMSQIPILPQHVWEEIDDPLELDPADVPTVGSGPFVFDRFDQGEYIRLAANPDHFSVPAVEAVEYVLFADTEGIFTALQTGELDMHTRALQSGQIDLAQGMDHLTLVSTPGIGYHFVVFNMREAPFDDLALRQAVAHATDRNRIVEEILDGRGDPGTSVISPANVAWHNPDVTQPPFDIEEARRILEEAGYSWDDSGRLLAPNG